MRTSLFFSPELSSADIHVALNLALKSRPTVTFGFGWNSGEGHQAVGEIERVAVANGLHHYYSGRPPKKPAGN